MSSQKSLTANPVDLRLAAKSLAVETKVSGYTALLPVAMCDAVIAAYGEQPSIGMERASGAVARLLRGFPNATLKNRGDGETLDFKAYTEALKEVFAKFGERECLHVTDPVDGYTWGHAFLPAIPEVVAALKQSKAKAELILSNARWHNIERERRAKQSAEPVASPEERAAIGLRMANLAASLKAKTDLEFV